MEIRVKTVSDFTRRMADIRIAYHPLKVQFDLVFNYIKRDIYQDSALQEENRVQKSGILRKNPDLAYVQDLFYDVLTEDLDKMPWTLLLTTTDLPRLPKNDDQIVIQEIINDEAKIIVYNIAAVKPINRDRPVVLECLIYPERNAYDSEL